jgi:hypothetical protein
MRDPAPLSSFRVRPRFDQTLAAAPAVVRAGLVRGLADQAPTLEVKSGDGYIGVHFPDAVRRYWSPRLYLNLDATPEGGTRIVGVYGPEIEIWSIFLYGYLGSGMLGIFSGILGFSQWWLGQLAWGLWVCGSMAVVALLLYLFAQLGQKLGAHQTYQLHQAYTAAAGDWSGKR